MESETPASEVTGATEAGASESPSPPADSGDAVATPEASAEPVPAPTGGPFWGTGRRKSAVARVHLTRGAGKFLINQRAVEDYFKQPHEQVAAREPLAATGTQTAFDVIVNVRGGGHNGQAEAVRLGVARALVKADSRHEPQLREKGYLTRDARVVERKKYGQRKARRRFQFSKR